MTDPASLPLFKMPASDRLEVDLSVVIVNYNVRDFLSQALLSIIRASGDLEVEIFVVDNNSIDNSVAMVRKSFPEVRLIANTENVGFGTANNQAIREARGRHILIINPDTIVQEDTLRTMVAFMDNNQTCGALGCQILNPDGSFAPESRRSFPTPEIAFYRMTGLGRLFPRSKRFGRYNLTFLSKDEESEVDALSGSCMMLRKNALVGTDEKPGSGLFDEDFFMYGEDLDLCYRIKHAGWQVWYTPRTQIIHYKGESTKKGEIRYVKLFYGAMLLFIEKHLELRHSTVLTFLLRAGIMVRAAMTVTMNVSRRLAPIILDFLGVYSSVVGIALFRYSQTGGTLSPLFLATTAPVFALATIIGIASVGGYRRRGRPNLGPVITGVLAGFILVASMSFFIQSMAFSRVVVVVSAPLSLGLLTLWRVVARRKRRGPRRAVLVGERAEADRLAKLLGGHPRPPFVLSGYVSDRTENAGRVKRLGRVTHLRDLVRLRGFDDIVFAARDVSNQTIFKTMRALRDLSVQFRMLHEGQEHVIGKSAISHLSVSSLQADVTEVVELRSPATKFIFEKALSLAVIPFFPLLWLFCRVVPKNSPARLRAKLILGLGRVLSGKIALIGCRPQDMESLPENWNIREGLFAVTNTMKSEELESEEIARAYWYYVTHQTPGLDLEIIMASLRQVSRDGVLPASHYHPMA